MQRAGLFERFLDATKATRFWPLWARLLGSAAIVSVAALIRELLPWLPNYPVMSVLVAVVVGAAAFGRAGGWLAVLLCDVFAVAVFLPHDGLALRQSSDVLGFLVFNAIALGLVGLIVEFQSTLDRLGAADASLARAAAALETAQRDKDLLLKESGHRIKNNLMTLIGVISVQQRSIDDEAARAALASTADRIHVFARVHDRLIASEGASAVDMGDFLRELCDDLVGAAAGARPVALETAIEDIQLPQHKAVAVGLIVNELLTNALKHAFPDEASGTVMVRFEKAPEGFRLEVRDDAIGLPATPLPKEDRGSIGQLLVRAMAAQLGGAFEIRAGMRRGAIAVATWPASATLPASAT